MKSFRDPVTGILKAWGYAGSNGNDLARDEPDGFSLEPGKWKLVGDEWTPVETSDADLIKANIDAVQSELDRQARGRGYDNIVSACTYAAGPNDDPFAAEGRAYLAWRSAVWAHAHGVLAEVEAGSRPMPTPEESVSMMPTLELP